nr:SCF ubiquitin ligase complex subunit Skp1 [Hymenolepis microstoma]
MPLKVRTKDGKLVSIEDDIVEQIGLFKCINRNASNEGKIDYEDSVVFLEPVPLVTLELVIKWCENHRGEVGDLFKGPAYEWRLRNDDKYFFSVHKDEVFRIQDAADYLQIKPLFDATCVAIADRLRDKDFNEISQEFDISTCEPLLSALFNKRIKET